MRRRIIRTLLHKEILRHAANRGGIVLVVLLMAASLLLSLAEDKKADDGNVFGSGIKRCYVYYQKKDDWIRHLQSNVPTDLADQIQFRRFNSTWMRNGKIFYAENVGGIQIDNAKSNYQAGIELVAPGGNQASLAPFENWFRKETLRYSSEKLALKQTEQDLPLNLEEKHTAIAGGMDRHSGIATSLVVFGLFFVCVYLMPSFSCEERESGVLLAQALSPARPREILAAKFLFYPVLALVLAVALGATYRLNLLLVPLFWLILIVTVVGCMGIGLTIASVARTQRSASMGAMAYLFVVALFLYVCQQANIMLLPYLALEYHCPRILHAVMQDAVKFYHWIYLGIAAVLACGWVCLATFLFRQRGWQT